MASAGKQTVPVKPILPTPPRKPGQSFNDWKKDCNRAENDFRSKKSKKVVKK